jgi:hypothetical protein
MYTGNETLRDRLLAQHVPGPEKLARYQKEVAAMLDRNERGLRREKWGMWLLWGFAVAYLVVFLLLSGFWQPTPERTWFCVLAGAGLLVLCGAVEIVKHFINRARIELLKELKRLELEVLHLRESLPGRTPG